MISPNFSIRLSTIYYLVYGILLLSLLNNLNKIAGVFFIILSYYIITSLKIKKNKPYKYTILKINQVILGTTIILTGAYIINKNITNYTILAIPLFIIPFVLNYLAIITFIH